LKIAGHAQNEQYQQYEQRLTAQREGHTMLPGIEALRTPSPG
jgi:hypothetical protein